MTETINGYKWRVLEFKYYKNGRRVGDGDTFSVIRRTKQLLGDTWKWVEDIEFESIRLPWVDTPESYELTYYDAARDLTDWINRSLVLGPIDVVCFGSAGWDRELGDLINANGESASQYLIQEKGWPVYEG